MSSSRPDRALPHPYRPSAGEVQDLMRRARAHPFGAGFLAEGALDAVAATFGVHAFVVTRARDALREQTPAGRR